MKDYFTSMMHPLFSVDSYKVSHYLQYPPGTTRVFSYIEARKTAPGADYTVFFGLQAIIKNLLALPVTKPEVEYASGLYGVHGLPFNYAGWMRIVNEFGGHLPLVIRAVPEGTKVPNGNVLVTVMNTHPDFAWLTSWVETALLRVWYPTSVATKSFQCKRVIARHLRETAPNLDGLPFKLHDFGARGVSSGESAALGGMGHLVNFMGTDTVEALVAARTMYGAVMAGYSIPAAEHSTITSWEREGELAAYDNMLTQFAKPGAILAVVSDSYDIYDAVKRLWGEELRQKVIDSDATVVIRPDSGDPCVVIPELLRMLDASFGSTLVTGTAGSFKLLNHVRVIQGDGIDNAGTIDTILNFVRAAGFSADNLAFGMGGGLLQQVNRDTFGFAMKASAARVNKEWRDVYKDPITDSGKKSKRGRLMLYRNLTNGQLFTDLNDMSWEDRLVIEPVLVPFYDFRDGMVEPAIIDQTLSEIRVRANAEV